MGVAAKYVVHRAGIPPDLKGRWDGPAWRSAETLEVTNFRPEGSDHRPHTRARLLYDDEAVYGIFHVCDRYVRCVRTEFYQPVCKDSCVEFFVQPGNADGYFNFEFNCGGAFLFRYQGDRSDPQNRIVPVKPSPEEVRMIRVYHSLPDVVDPELPEETEWVLEFAVPFALFARYVGPLGETGGQQWRANFYKCGDETSHPHWASWAPLAEESSHQPRCFGSILFEP